MIDKERFIAIIEQLKAANDFVDTVNNLIRKSNFNGLDFCDGACLMVSHETLVIELVEKMFSDEADEWISYFCYELDFGKKYKDGCVTDGIGADGGSNILLKTPEDLYNLLINNLKNKESKGVKK